MFAYCGNNPVNYSDPLGYCIYTAGDLDNDYSYSYMCPSCGYASGGGGGIGVIYPFAWLADTLSTTAESFEEWLEEQRKAIADALAISLAKSASNHSDNSSHTHHIVPQNDLHGLQAYIIVQEVFPELGVQDPRNLVEVSSRIHARLHTNLYYALVNNTITIAYLLAGDSENARAKYVAAALEGLKVWIATLELL